MDCGPYRAALSWDFIGWGLGKFESLTPEQQNPESINLDALSVIYGWMRNQRNNTIAHASRIS